MNSSSGSSSASCSPSNPEDSGQKRLIRKFGLPDDIVLLREVVAIEDIFSKPQTSIYWSKIAANVAKVNPRMAGTTPRACKERAEKLVRQFRTEDNWKARQSGTDEEYGEKERLLDEALSLFEEKEKGKERKKQEKADEAEKHEKRDKLANKIREDAMKTLGKKHRRKETSSSESDIEEMQDLEETEEKQEDNTIPIRGKKRRRRSAETVDSTGRIISYLTEKDLRLQSIRKEELKLEKEKFAAEAEMRKGMMDVLKTLSEKLK